MKSKYWAWTAFVLAVLYLLLILVSWIISSADPQINIHSLLSSEGIRWMMGHFAENLATPVLVWLLLSAIAYGVYRTSGLMCAITDVIHGRKLPYRQRFAFMVTMIIIGMIVLVVLILTCTPHAILLSVTGSLFNSSFSRALIPIIAFAVTVASIVFGSLSASYQSVEQVFRGMTAGISAILPLLVVYVFAAQLIQSVIYVFTAYH